MSERAERPARRSVDLDVARRVAVWVGNCSERDGDMSDEASATIRLLITDVERLSEELAEMTRRRDAWRDKAEGYDAVRRALREKVGAPWPPHLSRALWAGIAADEKKRADDAEAALAETSGNLHAVEVERDDAQSEIVVLRDEIGRLRAEALDAYGRGLMRAGRGSGE